MAAEDHPRQRGRDPQAAGVAPGAAHPPARRHKIELAAVAAIGSWSSRRSARSRATSRTTTPRASASTSRTTCACGSTTTCSASRSATTTPTRSAHILSTITTDIEDDPGLRFVGNARHPRRPADDRRDARASCSGSTGISRSSRSPSTPFLLLFVARFNRAVKKATHEVREAPGGDRLGGAAGTRVGPGGQGLRPAGPRRGESHDGEPRDRRRGAQGAADQGAALAGGRGRRRGLHRDRALARHGAGPRRRDDRGLAHRLPHLPLEVLQAGPGPREDEQHASRRRRWRSSACRRSWTPTSSCPSAPMRASPGTLKGAIDVRARRLRLRPESAGAEGRPRQDRGRPARRDRRPDRRREVHGRQHDSRASTIRPTGGS